MLLNESPSQRLRMQRRTSLPPSDNMIFVEKLQKIKEKAVLIWLSNGQIQVNFADCCILIENEANSQQQQK